MKFSPFACMTALLAAAAAQGAPMASEGFVTNKIAAAIAALPAPDYSTNNTALVETIEAVAPDQEEVDPTVPSWAKAAQKPTYTAGEVGAVPTTGGDMTGGLTVPNLTVGSRKSGSAVGTDSVAEGFNVTASEYESHAEGFLSVASGRCSHAEGVNTVAQNYAEHAQGLFNVSHKASDSTGNAGNTLSSIGCGTIVSPKNAVETMQDGKTFIYGLGGYDGTNPTGTGVQDLATAINSKASDSDIPPAVSNIVTTAYVRERLGVWMEYDEATGFYYYCHEEE